MSKRRRRFSPQFKAEAVQMVISADKPIAEAARDLGIHDGIFWELGCATNAGKSLG